MIDKVLYFDICAVPVYIIIIATTFYRKMTTGRSNRLYLEVAVFAFAADLFELIERLAFYGYTFNKGFVYWVKMSEYLYFMTRSAVNVSYLLFVISMTKTWYKIDALWKRFMLMLPYWGVLIMLSLNETTGWVFTVTRNDGYQRGSKILLIYGFAACYLVIGVLYLAVHRYTLDRGAWFSLLSMYFVNAASVLAQYFFPKYLIESFATSLTVLFVVMFVQRPEKQVDMSTGLPAYRAFCEELGKIGATGHATQIIIVSLRNAAEMSSYLKESYLTYLHTIDDEIRAFSRREKVGYELYFEWPGNFYIIMSDEKYNLVQAIPEIRENVRKNGAALIESGAQPDTSIVTVTFPKEIDNIDELLRFGHNFARFADLSRVFCRAPSIISKRSYQIEAHIDDILNRAVASNGLSLRYHPIWSPEEQRFVSAEAVIWLVDDLYGEIDPELLISAAEERGLMSNLGNRVIGQAFEFAGSEAFKRLGYDKLFIGLSVAQCMRMDITDTIWNIRETTRTSPSNIAFAIRESSYENMSSVFNENLKKLSAQGYTIVLDGFGHGYSNVQHLLDMPIKAVRLDKSIVRTAASPGGKAILAGMVEMVKEIPLRIMVQGADDKENAEMLCGMRCDLIQGHYYADPASKDDLTNKENDIQE